MDAIVVDSNVIVAALLDEDSFHSEGQAYVDGLERGDYTFHLPMLVVVEVAAAISRRAQRNRLPLLARAKRSIRDWEHAGRIILYELNHLRTNNAVDSAEQNRLRGSDAVIASLAEELDMPLRTFDTDIMARFPRASV